MSFGYILFLVPKTDMRNCCLGLYLSVHLSNNFSSGLFRMDALRRHVASMTHGKNLPP